jgi:hypothetical protein
MYLSHYQLHLHLELCFIVQYGHSVLQAPFYLKQTFILSYFSCPYIALKPLNLCLSLLPGCTCIRTAVQDNPEEGGSTFL